MNNNIIRTNCQQVVLHLYFHDVYIWQMWQCENLTQMYDLS